MAYFAVADRPNWQAGKRQGKAMGQREVAGPEKVQTRDDIIEANIRDMNAKEEPSNGAIKFIHGKEQHRGGKGCADIRIVSNAGNNIFGAPVENPRPTPRIRPGVSDDELRKIWAEDEKKEMAAKKMVDNQPTMVEKMLHAPVPPGHPKHSQTDQLGLNVGGKKPIHLGYAPGADEKFAPAGFRGIGSQCKDEGRRGVACHQPPEFEAPELVVKPRTRGKKIVQPRDTLVLRDQSALSGGAINVNA